MWNTFIVLSVTWQYSGSVYTNTHSTPLPVAPFPFHWCTPFHFHICPFHTMTMSCDRRYSQHWLSPHTYTPIHSSHCLTPPHLQLFIRLCALHCLAWDYCPPSWAASVSFSLYWAHHVGQSFLIVLPPASAKQNVWVPSLQVCSAGECVPLDIQTTPLKIVHCTDAPKPFCICDNKLSVYTENVYSHA